MKRFWIAILAMAAIYGMANVSSCLAGGIGQKTDDPSITPIEKEKFNGIFKGDVIYCTAAAGKKYDRTAVLTVSSGVAVLELGGFHTNQFARIYPPEKLKPVRPVFYRSQSNKVVMIVHGWEFILDSQGLRCWMDEGNLKRIK